MKLLVTGYDGILQYGGNVMEEDLKAIEKWRSEGNLYVIDTGRSKDSIDKEIEKFNIPVDYLITNNGGMIFDETGHILQSNYLDYVTSLDIMYIAKVTDGIAAFVADDGIHRHKVVVNPEIYDYDNMHLAPDMTEEEVMDLGEYTQISITLENEDAALRFAKEMNHHFAGLVNAYPNEVFVDVVPSYVSKATSLQFLQLYTDVDDEDMYAMGDSYNDIPMLDMVENSAVLSTAPEEVISHAKQTFISVSEFLSHIE